MSPASQFGSTGADFIAESVAPTLGIKKKDLRVAFLYEDTLYGTSTGGAAVKRALEQDLKVVGVETYSHKSMDLSPLVMRLKSVKPDVIFAVTYITDGQLFWRQAEEGGLNLKAFVDVGNWGDPKNAEVLGDEINYTFNVYLPTFGNEEGLLPGTRKMLETFNKMYKAKYNEDPGVDNYTGFQAGRFLFNHILPEAKSLDPEAVRKAALSMDLPIGSSVCGFGLKFAPPDHKMAGQNLKSMNAIHQWIKKKLHVVYPDRFAVQKPVLPMPAWGQRGK
jgi:branched-chain amino acid transport system substrate-binding protein